MNVSQEENIVIFLILILVLVIVFIRCINANGGKE